MNDRSPSCEADAAEPPVNRADTSAAARTLDRMSQELVDKLNAMAAEQKLRAGEFARRTHSLSPLPAGAEKTQATEAPPAEPTAAPQSGAAEEDLPPAAGRKEKQADAAQESEDEVENLLCRLRGAWSEPDRGEESESPKTQSGRGVWLFFIVILVIIYVLF